MIEFPPHFLWGTATSAYQVEGSPLADGAGASIWHRFAHTPGLIGDGSTGDVACDHYRRYRDDVALMRSLGTNAYRFSIAWRRVMPRGRGAVNPAGLDFYERLVDALLEHGIEPMVTLYHWDLPAALDDLGGWLNPDIAGLVRRVRGGRVQTARRTGQAVDDASTSPGWSPTVATCTARSRRAIGIASKRPSPHITCCGRMGRRCGPIAPRAGTASASS